MAGKLEKALTRLKVKNAENKQLMGDLKAAKRESSRAVNQTAKSTGTKMMVAAGATVGGVLALDKIYTAVEAKMPFLQGKRFITKMLVGGSLLLLGFVTKNPAFYMSAIVALGLSGYDKVQGLLGLASGPSVEGIGGDESVMGDTTEYDFDGLGEAIAGLDDDEIDEIASEVEMGVIDPVILSTLISLGLKGGRLAAPAIRDAVQNHRSRKAGRRRYRRDGAKKAIKRGAKRGQRPTSALPAGQQNPMSVLAKALQEQGYMADDQPRNDYEVQQPLLSVLQQLLSTPNTQDGSMVEGFRGRNRRQDRRQERLARALSRALQEVQLQEAVSETPEPSDPTPVETPTVEPNADTDAAQLEAALNNE